VLDRSARGAVEVAVHLGPLDELAALDHGAKGRLVDEVVFAALLVLAARPSGRVRDREGQVRIELEERLDQRRFARAAGRGDGIEVSGIVHAKAEGCEVYVAPIGAKPYSSAGLSTST